MPRSVNSKHWGIIEVEQVLMHSYELYGRGKVVVTLVAGSVLLVWLLDVALGAVDFEPQWWLSLPSFGGFYGILYQSFDHYCPASTIFAGWRQSVLPVHLLGLDALLGSVGPVAGDVKLQDDGVVHDPVNRRGGGHGVGKDALPLGEDQV